LRSYDINWINLDALLSLHGRLLAETGGCDGVLKPEALESALERPHTEIGGVRLFPSLFAKAAALAHSVATTHPFMDGNKRSALGAAATVLRINGFILDVDSEGAVAATLHLARKEWTLEQFAAWLEANAVPVEDD